MEAIGKLTFCHLDQNKPGHIRYRGRDFAAFRQKREIIKSLLRNFCFRYHDGGLYVRASYDTKKIFNIDRTKLPTRFLTRPGVRARNEQFRSIEPSRPFPSR